MTKSQRPGKQQPPPTTANRDVAPSKKRGCQSASPFFSDPQVD